MRIGAHGPSWCLFGHDVPLSVVMAGSGDVATTARKRDAARAEEALAQAVGVCSSRKTQAVGSVANRLDRIEPWLNREYIQVVSWLSELKAMKLGKELQIRCADRGRDGGAAGGSKRRRIGSGREVWYGPG